MKDNLDVFHLRKNIDYYSQNIQLQKPEATILDLLKGTLKDMKMIDVGVGTGRTIPFFAPLVKEYTAVDYSSEMINYCRKKFEKFPAKINFGVADMRDMKEFNSESFDFVLASYNCIDSFDQPYRDQAFKEMNRICRKGGIFCFSTHNIYSITELYKFVLRKNLFEIFRTYVKRRKVMKLNEPFKDIMQKNSAFIIDGAHYFEFKNYYSKPSEHIKELLHYGFSNIQAFDLTYGNKMEDLNSLETSKDFYIYYLCSKG